MPQETETTAFQNLCQHIKDADCPEAMLYELFTKLEFTENSAEILLLLAFEHCHLRIFHSIVTNRNPNPSRDSTLMDEDIHGNLFKKLSSDPDFYDVFVTLTQSNPLKYFPFIYIILSNRKAEECKTYIKIFNVYKLTDYDLSLLEFYKIDFFSGIIWQLSSEQGSYKHGGCDGDFEHYVTSDLYRYMCLLVDVLGLHTVVFRFHGVQSQIGIGGGHPSKKVSGFLCPKDWPEINTPTKLLKKLIELLTPCTPAGGLTVYVNGIGLSDPLLSKELDNSLENLSYEIPNSKIPVKRLMPGVDPKPMEPGIFSSSTKKSDAALSDDLSFGLPNPGFNSPEKIKALLQRGPKQKTYRTVKVRTLDDKPSGPSCSGAAVNTTAASASYSTTSGDHKPKQAHNPNGIFAFDADFEAVREFLRRLGHPKPPTNTK